VATTSVALGARVIEKHFTLSRDDKGPDSEFSLEPSELKKLCKDAKAAWSSLGKVGYSLKKSEKLTSRRSLYIVKDVKKDEKFNSENVKSIRPGLGLMPKYLDMVLQSKAACDISQGTPLSLDLIIEL